VVSTSIVTGILTASKAPASPGDLGIIAAVPDGE
jgi:hypothetical protein